MKKILFFLIFISIFILKPIVSSAAVEVYPGPGANAHKSDLYNVEIWDGSNWMPAYVYKRAKVSKMHWNIGIVTSVNFLTFGTTGQANVRVSKLSGSINSIEVSPKSKNIQKTISGGQATITLNINDKTWITINGDDANPLFIFADALKPSIPVGSNVKYFGPGVQDISPSNGNHYYASDNEIIYIDGGAWVRGNIISTGKTNVQIMGPGILSGDLWDSQTIKNLGWTGMQDYFMVYAASYGVVGDTTVKGITLVDSPVYNVYNVKSAYSAKVISPWESNTDGFNGVDIDNVFAFTGDTTFNNYMGYWSPTTNSYSVNTRLTNSFGGSANAGVILGGFYGNPSSANFTSTVDNMDIKAYNTNAFVPYGAPHGPSVFQMWVGMNDSSYGYKNQIYQNIRIEGNVNSPLMQLQNRVYPSAAWGGTSYDPPLGNSYNIQFKNVALEGQQLDGSIGKKSEIKGWDANNGFHNVLLENVSFGGTVVNQSNIINYIDVNSFVWGLAFAPAPTIDTFSASPKTVVQGSSSTLTWSTTNANSCTASGNWSGSKGTSGSQTLSVSTNSTYTLTCTNSGGGTATKSVNVSISQINPISTYTLDETSGTTASDSSLNSYSGTLLNYSGTSWTLGKVANGLNFDGVDDQVKISNATSLNALTGMTISSWINPRGAGGNGSGLGTIVSKKGVVGSSARFRLMMGTDGSSIQFNSAYSVTGGSWKTPTGSIPLNSWSHVALAYTHDDVNSVPKIYINGVLQTLTTLSTPSGTAISDDDIIYIGSRGVTATSGVFDGVIDQLRIHNREISSSEVTTLFNSENTTQPTTYYVSTTGSDSNSGSSTQYPWQTITKVNATNFKAGDQVLFQGGQTFSGTLSLDSADTGTAAKPVVISSYGTGRATINGGIYNGMWIYNTSGVSIKNINVVGSGPSSNTGSGIQFRTDLPGNVKLPYVYIDNVDVSGFKNTGISISGGNGKSGYSDVRITNCVVRDNGNAGLEIFGVFNLSSTAYSHSSVYVGYCKAYNNLGFAGTQYHSGNGIVIADIDGGVIEHSVAYNNGGNNTAVGGPIGIWAWDSNNVIIQYNESYGNKTNSTADGGGFDLDGGMTNSILQYNYAHDNEGPGFGFAQYGGARPFSNNVIRYNISQNDGKKNNTGGIGLWNGGSGIFNSHVYNNTVFVTPTATSPTPQGILFMTPTTNVSIRNNIIVTSGAAKMIDVAGGQSGLLFQGNSYWSTTGNFTYRWNGTNYNGLNSWRSATNQEKIGATNTGFEVNPMLTNPGGGGTLNDTTLLTTLSAYKLQSGSPLINQGLNLSTQFGLNTGTKDFYGNSIPQGSAYDVGVHDSTGSGTTFNFNLSSSMPTIKTMQAKSTTTAITASLTSGTSQTVSYSTSGLPTGATVSFSPTTCTPTCTTTLTINTLSSTPIGNSTITVTGTAGATTRTTTFTLDMNYQGDINNDGSVNTIDWSAMNSKWFSTDVNSDLNNDGRVNAIDFSIMNANWGKSG